MQYFLAIAFDQIEKGAIRLFRVRSHFLYCMNNTPFSHSVSFFNKSRGIGMVLNVFVTLFLFTVYIIIVAANMHGP